MKGWMPSFQCIQTLLTIQKNFQNLLPATLLLKMIELGQSILGSSKTLPTIPMNTNSLITHLQTIASETKRMKNYAPKSFREPSKKVLQSVKDMPCFLKNCVSNRG